VGRRFHAELHDFAGLSLAIGVLIDDAIVVRENIVRHMDAARTRHRARNGTAEIGSPSLRRRSPSWRYSFGGIHGRQRRRVFRPFGVTS